ncbi:hypothetical protein MLD38_019157 [Melastoma candidum]|uniref:Uncharacterized protein n=1 Tax=Melastoma candidum TaxID=119954 RepID=A0ACB9QY11_9MYRT|nr:hypothetical protein MLD38_019157 [Melastoma candidum]
MISSASMMSRLIENAETNLGSISLIVWEWPPMRAASFRDHVALILPLGFLVVMLILYVKTLICSAWRGNRCTPSGGDEMDPAVAKYVNGRSMGLSMTYKSSAVCLTLLLAARLMMVLITANGSYDSINSAVYVVSGEVVQAVAWVISLVVFYRVRRRRLEKFRVC